MRKPQAARARWWIAYQLNRLPGLCWANLVSWALKSRPITETRVDWICRKDFEDNGCCYCTKLRTPEADRMMRESA